MNDKHYFFVLRKGGVEKDMIRELAKSVREYKKASIMTPIWVALEVVLECIIPFIMAMLVNQIKAGCPMTVISSTGWSW